MSQTHTMFDDANAANYPFGAYAYAGYIDGYVTYPWLEANRKGAHLLSITVRNNNAARCIDVEPGASTQGAMPGFLNAHRGDKLKPVLYLMAGQATSICDWLGSLGHHRSSYVLWTAHVGQGMHFCGPATCGYGPGSNGTQWTWTAQGKALDQSIIDDSFFGGKSPQPNTQPLQPAQKIKPDFYRQVAGVTTKTESLYEYAKHRNTTAHDIALHTTDKKCPINRAHRATFESYRGRPGSTGATMPHGLVFYTVHA